MRTLITIIILLHISNLASAQKNFEGKITYRFLKLTEKKGGSMEAYFRNKKIKIHLRDSSKNNNEDDMLIDLQNGAIYYFNASNKEFKRDTISNKKDFMPEVVPVNQKDKYILNYHCSAYSASDNKETKIKNPTLLTTWLADSLFFMFDKKYATSDMIPMFGNGENISMELEMERMVAGRKLSIKTEPVLIQEQLLPDSVFSIPPGYVPVKQYNMNADSTLKAADSMLLEVEKAADMIVEKAKQKLNEQAKSTKKSPHKKTSSQNTHKQPTKPLAAKPKD